MVFATPAHAIFGFGDIVIDPTNLIQNALTATRTLQQVTDQARMLRNQVTQMTRLGIGAFRQTDHANANAHGGAISGRGD